MWKYACLCKGLFLIIFATNIWGLNIGFPRTREQIYIDVLKNITQVNNILQDLLQNYKQLKKDYEAKAQLQDDLSIETEFDGSSDKEAKYKRIKHDDEEGPHPVTQMILLDEGFQDDSSAGSNDEEEKEATKREVHSSSMENVEIDGITANQKEDVIENMELPIYQLDKPEITIIGTAVKHIEKSLSNVDSKPNQNEKSIFDELFNIGEEEYLRKNNFIHHNDHSVKPVLRVGFTDDNNKRNYNHIDTTDHTLRKWNTIRDYLLKMSLKKISRPNPKLTLVLVRSYNNEQNPRLIKDNYESDVNSEIQMIKDQLKSKILRDAYGDACLKVAVRKCYKTLLEVKRNVCAMDFRCKDSFKEHFKAHSKTACIKEFNYHGNQEHQDNETIQDNTFYKSGNRPGFDSDAVFKDIGRSSLNINYYDLCLPVMMTEVKTNTKQQPKRNKTTQKQLPRHLNKTEPINVLRDRYEMECRRMSREKCDRACQYAVSMTCDQHICMRREKREFNRSCWSECKNAFLPNGEFDYSDSDSSSDSYSDSDSDSISSW